MSKKSNFLISIVDKSELTDLGKYVDLPKSYNVKIHNLHISLHYSENAIFAKSSDENVIILFSGNIYQNDISGNESVEQYLLEKYLLNKKDFVKNLNGSFCLFFAQKDSGEIYFATDRLNTRKIFNFKKGSKLLFTTDINNLPLHECKLSYSGIASYLINGAIYNDLTLFEEITKLERSSLHRVVEFKVTSEKYWDYYFTNEFENRSESELSDELNHLYLQSLKRIITGKKNIFISLSGGHDSRGIAAMTKNIMDSNSNVICLSHNFGNNIDNTDSGIARRVAEHLGFTFKLLSSYNGDPFHTLKYNAKYGQGLAYFCIESDAWEQFKTETEKYENSILLVGDMNDGTFTQFHGNNKRALERTQIYESDLLNEYKNYFSQDVLNNLFEHWDKEYDKILNKISIQDNMVNLLDYLYIDQRIPDVNCIARECFQMWFIETATPYYDNVVLDFMRKLPIALRDNRKLHKRTLESNYPEIFGIKSSSDGWGYEPSWINEIYSNSDVFINNINNNLSNLDNIISPEKIINLLLDVGHSDKNKYSGKTALKSLHKTVKKVFPAYYKLIEMFPGGQEFTRKAGRFVNPRISHILPKILILRLFLNSIGF